MINLSKSNSEILEEYLSNNPFTEQSIATRRSSLNYFFSQCKKPLRELKPVDMDKYFMHLVNRKDLTKTTKKNKFGMLKSFLKWYMYILQEAFIVFKPNRSWGINHKKPNGDKNIIATIPELEMLLNYSKNRNFKHYLIYRVFIETGCRKGELINLKTVDVNLEERYFYTKGKTEDKLYAFSEGLVNPLRIYINSRNKNASGSDNLFITNRGKPYGLRVFNLILQKILDRIPEIKKHFTTKTFRKTINTLRKHKLNTIEEDRKRLIGHKGMGVNVLNYTIFDKKEHVKLYDDNNPYRGANF